MAIISLASANMMDEYDGNSENAIDMYLFNLTKEKTFLLLKLKALI